MLAGRASKTASPIPFSNTMVQSDKLPPQVLLPYKLVLEDKIPMFAMLQCTGEEDPEV